MPPRKGARSPPQGNRQATGSGGSMVARLKLEGIDGRIPPDVEFAAQSDSTQQPYQAKRAYGATD